MIHSKINLGGAISVFEVDANSFDNVIIIFDIFVECVFGVVNLIDFIIIEIIYSKFNRMKILNFADFNFIIIL